AVEERSPENLPQEDRRDERRGERDNREQRMRRQYGRGGKWRKGVGAQNMRSEHVCRREIGRQDDDVCPGHVVRGEEVKERKKEDETKVEGEERKMYRTKTRKEEQSGHDFRRKDKKRKERKGREERRKNVKKTK
ncbi:uncharacterized, partial [Tachysurus ichikawai]